MCRFELGVTNLHQNVWHRFHATDTGDRDEGPALPCISAGNRLQRGAMLRQTRNVQEEALESEHAVELFVVKRDPGPDGIANSTRCNLATNTSPDYGPLRGKQMHPLQLAEFRQVLEAVWWW
jgi:hypothetical protein